MNMYLSKTECILSALVIGGRIHSSTHVTECKELGRGSSVLAHLAKAMVNITKILSCSL